MRKRKVEISAFSWYGGKTYHLEWLLPLVNSVPHKTYIESFSGSAAVLLNKKPSDIEIYNDVHSEVVNFFRVLRTQGAELIALLELTPYSREEFAESCKSLEEVTPLEKARLFFVKARQVRNGLATMATPGRWSYTKKDSREGKGLPVNQWLNSISNLPEIVDRIKNVQIECLDALDVIERYDTADSLHYIDPPYLMSSRTGGENYCYEFSEEQHEKLLKLLLTLQGKVILSGYINELYPSILKGWQESKRMAKLANATLQNGKKQFRQEVIWTNFNYDLNTKGWEC